LENWIEQQRQLGNSVIVLGDFNRRLNRFDGDPERKEHFCRDLNDGTPRSLKLRKGPFGNNDDCWENNPKLYHKHYIDFIIFDDSLSELIDVAKIKNIGLPHEDEPNSGFAGQKLSDHCPENTGLIVHH